VTNSPEEASTGKERQRTELGVKTPAEAPSVIPEPDPPVPDSPVHKIPPETEIRTRLEKFLGYFTSRNLAAIENNLSAGRLPGEDSDLLKAVFDRALNLSAELISSSISAGVDGGTADIALQLKFQQARTGESASMKLKLRLEFTKVGEDWLLKRVRRA
jgi:hypothetical protein